MPSAFDTAAAEQLVPDLLEEFGTSGWTYTPPSGDATSGLSLIVDESQAALEFVGVEEMSERNGLLKVAVADLAGPVAQGKFSAGSATWVVTGPPVQRAGWWHCPCEYDTRQSVGKKQ